MKEKQKYLKTRDICDIFNVSINTVYLWRKEGMPFFGKGMAIFYEEDKVVKWLGNRDNADKVETVREIKEVVESVYPKKS